MANWSPEWRVKIDGIDVTDATLADLAIQAGRTDIYQQPIASYCSINLVKINGTATDWDINDSVTVEVKNSTGTWIQIFGGFLTDVDIEIGASGSTAIRENVRLIALGALARITKQVFVDNLVANEDGDQIYYVLSQALFNRWNQIPASLTWATYDPTVQWQDAENSGLGDIDRPGNYELDHQNNLEENIYSLASRLAKSGLGYLYEDEQGRIGYADSTHRAEYLATNGYVDLSANHAYGPGLRTSKKAGDVRNAITLQYTTNGTSSVTDSEPESIALYGELAEIIPTTLKNQSDATSQAAFYLQIRAFPQAAFRNITYPLGNPELDNNDRDALISVFMGMPINLTDLPISINNGSFQGFVEGWYFRATTNDLKITLTMSPVAYSLEAFRWQTVPATEQWQTVSPTLDWLNATIVA